MKTIVFYVNSQFGIGHFKRCSSILKALEKQYDDVLAILIFGGIPCGIFSELKRTIVTQLPGLTFHRANGKVGHVPKPLDSSRSIDEVFRERRNRIASTLRGLKVDVVFLEYFPFSKQSLNDEVSFLLNISKQVSSPLVVSSIRDYMTIDAGFSRKFAEDFVKTYCSYILVHSDPKLAELHSTYGNTNSFQDKIRYTGYVVDYDLSETNDQQRNKTVVVSVGGGRDGSTLLKMFCDALRMIDPLYLANFKVEIFPGLFLPENAQSELIMATNKLKKNFNIGIKQFSEYHSSIGRCHLSISMCGYNTSMELLTNRVSKICFVPRERTEQLMRARMLSNRRLATVVSSAEQLSRMLIDLPSQIDQHKGCDPSTIDLTGAKRSASFLHHLTYGYQLPDRNELNLSDSYCHDSITSSRPINMRKIE